MTAARVVDDVRKGFVTISGRIEVVTTASVEECPRIKLKMRRQHFPLDELLIAKTQNHNQHITKKTREN